MTVEAKNSLSGGGNGGSSPPNGMTFDDKAQSITSISLMYDCTVVLIYVAHSKV